MASLKGSTDRQLILKQEWCTEQGCGGTEKAVLCFLAVCSRKKHKNITNVYFYPHFLLLKKKYPALVFPTPATKQTNQMPPNQSSVYFGKRWRGQKCSWWRCCGELRQCFHACWGLCKGCRMWARPAQPPLCGSTMWGFVELRLWGQTVVLWWYHRIRLDFTDKQRAGCGSFVVSQCAHTHCRFNLQCQSESLPPRMGLWSIGRIMPLKLLVLITEPHWWDGKENSICPHAG